MNTTTTTPMPATMKPGAVADFDAIGARLFQSRKDLIGLLTAEQANICLLLLQDRTISEVGDERKRSRNTAADHVKALYKKLRVNNRVQLVLLFTQPVAGGGA